MNQTKNGLSCHRYIRHVYFSSPWYDSDKTELSESKKLTNVTNEQASKLLYKLGINNTY